MAIVDINEIASISGNSRALYANLLKYLYLPIWSNWVHSKVKVPALVAKKKGKKIGGKLGLAAVTTDLPQSAGIFVMEGYRMPTPRTGTHKRPELISRSRFSRLRWTGHVERAARMGDAAAWVAPRKKDMADARLQDGLNYASQLYLGKYETRGIVSSYAAGVVTLYARNSRTSGSGADAPRNYFKTGAHYLRTGMSISLVTSRAAGATGGVADGAFVDQQNANFEIKVSALDDSVLTAPTITLVPGENSTYADIATLFAAAPGGQTPADGDSVIMWEGRKNAATGSGPGGVGPGGTNVITSNGASGAAQGDYAPGNGIGDICSDGSKYAYLYGLVKADIPKLNGKVFHNDGVARAWSEMLLTLAMQRTRAEGSGVAPGVILMNESSLREVVKENRGDRRFMPIQTESGFQRLVHTAGDMTTPYMEDWQAPPGVAIGIYEDEWEYYEDVPLQPVDEVPERWIPDYDQHEIALVEAGNVACEKPHANLMLDDLIYDQFSLTP